MKLYRVKLRGMQTSYSGTRYGDSYVVADDPSRAYEIVKSYCKKADVGFDNERELHEVTLVAEEGDYPKCQTQLHIDRR